MDEAPVPELMLTRAQGRRVDALAIERYGIPGIVLMENAGRGAVDALLAFDPSLAELRGDGRAVAILCGRGNNAGDGFVMARHLAARGVASQVVLLGAPAELRGDARVNYEILLRSGRSLADLSQAPAGELPRMLDTEAGGAVWLVDALLGTGAVGAPREPFRTAIVWLNEQQGRRLAVDVPSGLDCDTGVAADVAVRADLTCTFAAAKPGLVAPAGRPFTGVLRVVDLAIPRQILLEASATA